MSRAGSREGPICWGPLFKETNIACARGAWREAGRFTVPVTRTYGLTDVSQAFKDFTAGSLGKLAIAVR